MPKFVEIVRDVEPLNPSEERLAELEAEVHRDIEDAISARHFQEERWVDDLRRYDAIPRNPSRFRPIQGRQPIEVALGAIATDAIYAQELALIFGTSPILTARSVGRSGRWTRNAKAIQTLANYIAANPEYGLRESTEESLLDKNKLGTGFFYIPWVERIKRTRTRRIRFAGPKIRYIAVEDCIAPGGSTSCVEDLPWIALRFWLNSAEMAEMEDDGWDIDLAQPIATMDRIRQQRERLGQTSGETKRSLNLYEIITLWKDFDIDNDGKAERLKIIYDRTTKRCLKVSYDPYDHTPIEVMRYLRRGGLFYGRGVMDITRQNQEMATDIMNNWLDNAFLANVRMWAADPSANLGGTMTVWPGRVVQSANPDGIRELRLSDVYGSMPQLFMANQQLTERRTGVNELTQSPLRALGNRTPGITALSALQSQNQRFTAVFDSGRNAVASSVKQCLYRFQERLLAGDEQTETYLIDILGDEEGDLAIEVLKSQDFDESITIELTASSASINKDTERQNALLLANFLGTYYQRMMEMVNLVASPQVPEEVVAVARKVMASTSELIDRTLRTFDQVRDPTDFIIDMERELNKIEETSPESAVAGLLESLLGAGGGGAGQAQPFAGEAIPFAGAQG